MLLSSRFRDALTYATQLHAGQSRKASDVPYISHLLAVASIVLDYGGTEDEAIAALLHDAIEDQGGASTREKIRQLFGEAVVGIVNGCSDSETIPKPPWRERKEKYLEHLCTASSSVLLVSAADKLHNIRTMLIDYQIIGEQIWQRFTGGKDGTLWYYRAVVDVLIPLGPKLLVGELERAVIELESIACF
jgi:(p)ppGpp synthase/HD superfamily hydrolase